MTHPTHKPEAMEVAALFEAGWIPNRTQHAEFIRRLHAECESLRTQLAEAEQSRDKMRDLLSRTAVAIRGAEPELTSYGWADLPERAEALRADARRYRWLRDVAQGSDWEHIGNVYPPEETDAAIDAAMGAKEGE